LKVWKIIFDRNERYKQGKYTVAIDFSKVVLQLHLQVANSTGKTPVLFGCFLPGAPFSGKALRVPRDLLKASNLHSYINLDLAATFGVSNRLQKMGLGLNNYN